MHSKREAIHAQAHRDDRPLRLVAGPGGTYGNTLESFQLAVQAGADTIEMDVIWTRDGHPHIAAAERTPLIVAHDWHDAERRKPLTLEQGLDAFVSPSLENVEIDLDIKLPGREEELVAALRERDLVGRAMISTMELSSIARIGELEPKLRRGWSYPKVTKEWSSRRWAKVPVLAALRVMRRRLPNIATQKLTRLGVSAMWVYHPLISPSLGNVCRRAGVELIAWKIDEEARMRALLDSGATGICSNDPQLFLNIRAGG